MSEQDCGWQTVMAEQWDTRAHQRWVSHANMSLVDICFWLQWVIWHSQAGVLIRECSHENLVVIKVTVVNMHFILAIMWLHIIKQPVDRESNFGITLTNNMTNNLVDLTFWSCCITAQHKWLSCALCHVLHHNNHCQQQQRMQTCKLIGHFEPLHLLFIKFSWFTII